MVPPFLWFNHFCAIFFSLKPQLFCPYSLVLLNAPYDLIFIKLKTGLPILLDNLSVNRIIFINTKGSMAI